MYAAQQYHSEILDMILQMQKLPLYKIALTQNDFPSPL